MHHHFSVSIEKDTLNFIRSDQTMFQAKISPSTNAAFLVGESVPVEEFTSLSSTSTLPLDLDLWHRRLGHHPSSLHLQHSTLALSTSRDHVLSGSQSNGQSHSTTSRSGSPLQPFHLLMKRMTTQMIPLTSSMRTQPLSLSPHLTNSHSNALRRSYGTQHVRRRWKLTESMAPGMSSNCPLGSVQLGPDGS